VSGYKLYKDVSGYKLYKYVSGYKLYKDVSGYKFLCEVWRMKRQNIEEVDQCNYLGVMEAQGVGINSKR
jgi:hypothetical protein